MSSMRKSIDLKRRGDIVVQLANGSVSLIAEVKSTDLCYDNNGTIGVRT